ncbi:MAG: hypothetical protein LIO58_05110 [Oscillospiraceae bacterium]|nr:hypothetical protein [Oscillospiraceae bacterium]
MRMHSFISGIGLGAMVGAAVVIGMNMTPRQRQEVKRGTARAARAVGDAVEDMSKGH